MSSARQFICPLPSHLQEELQRQERNRDRAENANLEYLKNIVLAYITSKDAAGRLAPSFFATDFALLFLLAACCRLTPARIISPSSSRHSMLKAIAAVLRFDKREQKAARAAEQAGGWLW